MRADRKRHGERPQAALLKTLGATRRQVVRIITPGTLTDEALLEARRDNLVAAVCRSRRGYGLAWLDLSAGRFLLAEPETAADLQAELARLKPAEQRR